VKRNDGGAAAVEFALVLIPLLLIIFGMVDFGYAYYTKITVSNAAHEGARASALGDSSTEVTTRVDSIISGAAVSNPACGQVTVTKTLTFLTPLPSLIPGIGPAMPVSGKGEEKCYG
jgi:Flp pilus assembly protein TadG